MITGSPRIELISGSNRFEHIRSALCLPPTTNTPELSYELLRNVAWASTAGRIPVPRHTLLDRAMAFDIEGERDNVRPVDRRRALSDKLEDLARLGDIAVLKRGHCVSTPGVVVQRPRGGDGGLLVSGIPVCRLSDRIQSEVLLEGPLRKVSAPELAQQIGIPAVRVDDWIRRPRLDLAEWTDTYVSMPMNVDPDATDTAATGAYLPSRVRRGSRHFERWFSIESGLEGRHLVRFTAVDGTTSHHVAEIADGKISGLGEELVHDVARLMHGLDARYSNPTIAYWSTVDGGVRLRTSEHLPPTETRALVALTGSPATGRTWTLTDHFEEARQVLAELNIVFVTGSPGR